MENVESSKKHSSSFDMSSPIIQQHPLLIEQIFRNITKNSLYLELITYSQVCEAWFHIVEDILSERATIIIDSTPSIDDFKKLYCTIVPKFSSIGSLTIQNLDLDLLLYRGNLIFNKPQLQLLSKLKLQNVWVSKRILDNLFELIGHRLAHLDISIDIKSRKTTDGLPVFHPFPVQLYTGTDYNPEDDDVDENNNKRNQEKDIVLMPNMKTLKFMSNLSFFNISGIATSFPNLEELEISCSPNVRIDDNDSDDNMLEPPLRKLKLPFLNKLTLCFPVNCPIPWDTHLNDLMKIDLHLDYVEFGNISEATNMKIIQDFLNSQKNTLQVLKLFTISIDSLIESSAEAYQDVVEQIVAASNEFNELSSNELVSATTFTNLSSPFPESLPNLTELWLSKLYTKNLDKLCKICPNLKKCTFAFLPGETWYETMSSSSSSSSSSFSSTQFSTVENLVLTWIQPHEILLLSQLFPNVKKLLLNFFTNEMLAIVLKVFVKLEVLHMGDCPASVMTDFGLVQFFDGKLKETLVDFSNIGDLRGLEELVIVSFNNSITNKSFIPDILSLSNLKKFYLFGIDIAPASLNQLQKSGLEHVQLQNEADIKCIVPFVHIFLRDFSPFVGKFGSSSSLCQDKLCCEVMSLLQYFC